MAVLVALGLFLTAGIESTISGWMPTYAVSTGLFDMSSATICGTLFWTMSTIFRFVSAAIRLNNRLKLRILIASIFCCSLACLLLHYLQLNYLLIVAGSLGFGFSCSAVFPLIMSISTEYRIRFRPDQLSTMMITPSFSSFLVAGLTGVLMHWDMRLLFYSLSTTSAALWLVSVLFFRMMERVASEKQISS